MPKRNRRTLKECFRQGKKPSEQDFENLIDSTINILDDGLFKRADTGIALAPLQGNNTVVSVFREAGDDKAAWEIAVDSKTGNLQIGQHQDNGITPMITLRPDGGMELGEESGEIYLKGILNTPGINGSFLRGSVPANGKWHNVTEDLEGCWALDVTAGCGRRNTGKYALLTAAAIHCFGKHAKISKTRSHYGMYGNKLCIRWVKCGFACRLQLKTIFNYGDDIQIKYQIAKRWNDPLMNDAE